MKTKKRITMLTNWEDLFIRMAIEMARRRHMRKCDAVEKVLDWMETAHLNLQSGLDPFTGEKK